MKIQWDLYENFYDLFLEQSVEKFCQELYR